MKNKIMAKTLRIDEVINNFTMKKIAWVETENEQHIYIITKEGNDSLRYIFDKRDGFLTHIQKASKKPPT